MTFGDNMMKLIETVKEAEKKQASSVGSEAAFTEEEEVNHTSNYHTSNCPPEYDLAIAASAVHHANTCSECLDTLNYCIEELMELEGTKVMGQPLLHKEPQPIKRIHTERIHTEGIDKDKPEPENVPRQTALTEPQQPDIAKYFMLAVILFVVGSLGQVWLSTQIYIPTQNDVNVGFCLLVIAGGASVGFPLFSNNINLSNRKNPSSDTTEPAQ